MWNKYVVYLLVMLAFTMLYALLGSNGLSLSFDSYEYLIASHSFLESGVMMKSNDELFVYWPPLFPILLAYIARNTMEGVMLLNYFSLLSTVFLLVKWFINTIKNSRNPIVYFYALIVTFSIPYLLVGKFIWSEPFFIFLLTSYLYSLNNFLKKPSSKYLILITIFGFLMPLQRFAGLFVFLGVGIALSITEQKLLKRHWKMLLLSVVISLSGVLCWLIYTRVGGMESRESATFSWTFLLYILRNYGEVMARWFMPVGILPYLGNGFYIIAFITVMVCVLVVGIIQNKKNKFISVLSSVILCYVGLYILAGVYKKCAIDIQEVERFMSPVFGLIFFVFMFSISGLYERIAKFQRVSLIILLSIWITYPVIRAVKNANAYRKLPRVTGVPPHHFKQDFFAPVTNVPFKF
ncbi:hypothetical protein V6R21_29910 [Limibacter armeniacum]|uniref:hypothetical protein n=1 Tax=Limibacter armeniacum TaxID=466084 RepID=UPI002FE68805